jgi:hypothetical protein
MFLPLLVVPVVSLLTKPPKSETVALAFGDPIPRRQDDKKVALPELTNS